jgi:hypothetical protein
MFALRIIYIKRADSSARLAEGSGFMKDMAKWRGCAGKRRSRRTRSSNIFRFGNEKHPETRMSRQGTYRKSVRCWWKYA